jgi:flagellar hook-associated protein 2
MASDQAGTTKALAALIQPTAAWARASGGITGAATRAKEAAQTQSRNIGTQIDGFQVILDQREARYRNQFAKLETLLGQLKDQSSWLASQIAGLGQG